LGEIGGDVRACGGRFFDRKKVSTQGKWGERQGKKPQSLSLLERKRKGFGESERERRLDGQKRGESVMIRGWEREIYSYFSGKFGERARRKECPSGKGIRRGKMSEVLQAEKERRIN